MDEVLTSVDDVNLTVFLYKNRFVDFMMVYVNIKDILLMNTKKG